MNDPINPEMAARAAEPAARPNRRAFLWGGGALALAGSGWFGASLFVDAQASARRANVPLRRSDAEWRQRLTPMQYYVLRQAGTERPNSHPLNREHRAGTFLCAGCELPLFRSQDKYDSGTGWPSFTRAIPRATGTATDFVLGYPRSEIHCARCGGHLGHRFDDGPQPTGQRWCMNGAALTFRPA